MDNGASGRRLGKICLTFIVLILLWTAYDFGYHSGYTAAGKARVWVDVDGTDAKVTYDPYFTKANPIPANPIPGKAK
jgi:hypothetical protein